MIACLLFLNFLPAVSGNLELLIVPGKSYKMADRGGEYSFFQDTHVTIDKRINISSSKRHMTTKFTEHVHLQELTQMRLIKQVLVTPWRQDHVTN